MSYGYNIYGIDWNKIRKEIQELRNSWIRQGLCPLCGRDHSKDKPLPAYLKCPYCGEVGEYKVRPHCPGGVSHEEIHTCPSCNKQVFLVIYYDGEVFIEK